MTGSASSFQALRNRALTSPLSGAKTLSDQSGESTTKNYDDERYWKLARSADGNGAAVIRFLDVGEKDSGDKNNLPFVKIYDHAFAVLGGKVVPAKTAGAKWYIEKSLSTFGFAEQDIVGIKNSELWNSGLESDKEIARSRKRRLRFTSNILVINDPANPENNGKCFLFEYGKQIADMIDEVKCPAEDPLALEPVVGYDPFCFWKGANFTLKIRNKEGTGKDVYPSYDKSAFQAPTPLFGGDDAKIEALWSELYSLQELLDRKHFKTQEELKKRFEYVYGITSAAPAEAPAPTQEAADEDVPMFADKTAPKPKKEEAAAPFSLDDDDDDLKFFADLAGGSDE
jgi:hypothetical protein